ncbi:MAG: hypothetical protein ACFE8J_10515 [Candidatus Heimdallarchaeota archaeon]
MVRKGRFKLLSYFIEDSLIFYKSMNKNRNIIAFSIFKTLDLPQTIEILNDLIKRKFLYYYSIQFSLCEQYSINFLLCFKDIKKSTITKFYNLIREKILASTDSTQFFSKKELENNFLNVIEGKIDSNIKVWKHNDALLINNEQNVKFLRFYDLDLNYKKKNDSILYYLLNLFKDFNKNGYFIFNFKSNDIYEITLSAYYVDILKKEEDRSSNLEYEINKFFNSEILKKHILSIGDMINLIWRFRISGASLDSNNFIDLFNFIEENSNTDLIKFNKKFEQLLNQNEIKFQRLSLNLIFIEQRILFLTLLKLDFKLIIRLSKKFYLKYKIYILFLDDKEYQKVEKIDKIKELENLKIVCYSDFLKFNLGLFKKELMLENP